MTRLQTLLLNRISEEAIQDHELFDEGELEGFLRSDAEVELLRVANGWEAEGAPPETSLQNPQGIPESISCDNNSADYIRPEISGHPQPVEEGTEVEDWHPMSPSCASPTTLFADLSELDWS